MFCCLATLKDNEPLEVEQTLFLHFYLVISSVDKSIESVDKSIYSVDKSRYSVDRVKEPIYCHLVPIKDTEMLLFECINFVSSLLFGNIY